MSPFGLAFVVLLLLYMFIVEPILELIIDSIDLYLLDRKLQKLRRNREAATKVETPCTPTVWKHYVKNGKEWWIRKAIEEDDDDEQQVAQELCCNKEVETEVEVPCKRTVWEHHTKDGKEWWIRRVVEDDNEQQIAQELKITQKSNES